MNLSRRLVLGLTTAALAAPALAAGSRVPEVSLPNIDGGAHETRDWAGHPVLLVNTASQCGYTPQYAALQQVHEAYGPRGLIVMATPSDDFLQELNSNEAVKEFCDVNYGLTLPMTDIIRVTGPQAHPLYRWLKTDYNFQPRWNFNKVLIGKDGTVIDTFRSGTKPDDPVLLRLIEEQLA